MDAVGESGSFVVAAGNGRNFRFDGTLLAVSSSWRKGAERWVEFSLYQSKGGAYILSRVGKSLLFHLPDCEVVARNGLRIGAVPNGGVGCGLCGASASDGAVCPEEPRYWAAMFTDPQKVVAAVERNGDGGKYVTHVAARLMEAASMLDKGIADAWLSVRVD